MRSSNGRRLWTASAVVLGLAARFLFASNPPQGSVGPSDGSSTSWSGVVPTPTPASTPVAAENFSPPSPTASPFKPSNTEAGWTFTVNEPILVTHVGVWDGPNDGGTPGDGLTEAHTLRIYDSQGRNLLPITIVKPTESLDPDGFRYVALTDGLILRPGTYTVSATYDSGFEEVGRDGTNTDNTMSVSYIEGAISTSNDPDQDPGMPVPDGSSGSYFGPNFKFTPTTPPNPALVFQGGTPAPPSQQGERGWAFTVNRPVVITDLGVYDEGGDGLTNRLVSIRDATGQLVVQQFVSGNDPVDDSSFHYRTLAMPVTLSGGSYTISTFFSNGDNPYVTNASFVGTDPRITYNGAVLDDGSCFSGFQGCVPTQKSSDKGYFGPNFRIIPEPLKDQFVLNVEGNRVEYKQQALRVKVEIASVEPGKDFDVYVYEAVPQPTPEPVFPDDSPTYKEGPLVAYAAHQGSEAEATYFYPSELGAGPYLVDVYYRSGGMETEPNAYNGTATVENIPMPQTAAAPTYKTSGNGGTITFGPSVTLKAPFAGAEGNPQNRTDVEGNNYIGAMRGAPAGIDLWYIDLRPVVDDPNNPGQPIPNPTFDPNTRVPLYRGQPISNFGSEPGFDGYLALAVAPTSSPAPIGFSELLGGMVTPGNSGDRGQSLSANNPVVLPFDQNGNPRAISPQQWEESLNESVTYLYYRTYPFDLADTGEVFIHRSNDGGSSFDGPRNLNIAIGRLGPLDVDQTTGAVYGAGSTGNVLIGIPSSPTVAPDTYTLSQAITDPNGIGHALFVTKIATDGTIYGAYSNGQDIFLVSSSDVGQTWSAPVRVNSDTTQTNIFPWLETGPSGKVGLVWYATANVPSPGASPNSRQPNDDSAEWKVYFAQITGANAPAPTIEIAEVTQPQHYVHAGNIFDRGYDPSSPEFDFTTTLTNHNLFDYIQISFDPQGAAVVSYTDDHNDYRGDIYVARQITGPGIAGDLLPALVQGKAPEGAGLSAPMPTPGDPTFPPPQPDPGTGAQVSDFAFDWNELGNDAMDVRTVRYGTTGPAGELSLFAAMTVTNLNSIAGLLNLSQSSVPAWRMSFSVHPSHAGLSKTDPAAGQYSFAMSDRGDQFYFEARPNLQFFQAAPVSVFLGMQPFEFIFGVATRNSDGSISYSDIAPADFGFLNFNLNTIYVQVSVAKLNAVLPPGHALIGDKTIVAGLRGQTLIEPLTIGIHQGEQAIDTTRGGTELQISDPSPNPSPSATPAIFQFDAAQYNAHESDGLAIITVRRSGDTTSAATIDFATDNDTAVAGSDYTSASGTLSFASGETAKLIKVPLLDDDTQEPTEDFTVVLSNPTGGATLGSPSQAFVVISDDDGAPSPSPSPSPTPSATPSSTPASQTVNLSTRMRVGVGDNAGIGGFIITGAVPKHVIVRAIGPSLTKFGFTEGEVLSDPRLEIHGPGSFGTITNDNWRESQEAQIKADGLPPTNDLESAIDATLPPGTYTAIVSDTANGAGIALVEVYDLDMAAASKLANLSTRALVGTGGNVVIAGFVLGNQSGVDRILIRGLGPSLASHGISNPLIDPTLELRDGNGSLVIADNDWQDDPAQAAQITADGLAPSDSMESALAATLSPGLYTAILSGRNNGTGIGLVEVYDLGP
ncbi:MAG: Calx-beta domain-containing protein [Chthoniobacterales bacterium]